MKKFRIRILHDYFDYKLLEAKLNNTNNLVEENNGNSFLVKYVNMHPFEYIRQCSKMMGLSIDRLLQSRNDDSLKILMKNKITPNNCGLIYIDEYHKMQDGLHRAIVLNELGYSKIKVMVISKLS